MTMESTAQYWRTVWLELEPHMLLHLAHAFSNRAPRGRKHDFKDAERLVRRLFADELILSFVPNGEQRIWRNLTRMKMQLTRDRIRLQSQMECLLEEMRIKLSSVVTDLLGASGLRILRALAAGETEAKRLAALGDNRLKCTAEQLLDALRGSSQPMHREMLALQLERLQLIDTQIAKLNHLIAQAMRDDQRHRVWVFAAEMQVVDPGAVNLGDAVWISVQHTLLGTPVVLVQPVIGNGLHPVQVEPVRPSRIGHRVRPSGLAQAPP